MRTTAMIIRGTPMLYVPRVLQRRAWRFPALVLLLALAAACGPAATEATSLPSAHRAISAASPQMPADAPPVSVAQSIDWFVPPSLEEQIFTSSVIVRASLESATPAVERVLSDPGGAPTYRAVQELRFTVHEYLKGSGPTTLLVAVRGEGRQVTEAAAREFAESATAQRVTTWDDRQGVLFLSELPAAYVPAGQAAGATRNAAASALAFTRSNNQAAWDYSVDTLSRAWLPARDAAGAGGASGTAARTTSQAYITDGAKSPPPVVALTDLRAQIAALAAELRTGAGVAGFQRCISGRIGHERARRAVPLPSRSIPVQLASGVAANTDVFRSTIPQRGDPQYSRFWLSGSDHERFQALIIDDDDQSSTGYDHTLATARPLPAGTYEVRYNEQHYLDFPCNFVPDDAYNPIEVQVTAPAGTVHEAFFDPVAVGAGVGADNSHGALTPTGFTVGGTAAALQRLNWEAKQLQLELSAAVPLANHYLDLIGLDGAVALRLGLDDATTATIAGGGQAWRWPACAAPWAAGDQLMLRLHHSATALPDVTPAPGCGPAPTYGAASYAFTVAEDAAVGAAVGTVTATAAGGTAVIYTVTAGDEHAAFAIDGSTGALTVARPLDYETAASYTLTVAAHEEASAAATTTVTITVTDVTVDYDAYDDDGLIEVANLAQLHAIRWDLDGDGTATDPGYAQAFPDAMPGMGCPATGCVGYELTADLEFDTDGNGVVDAADAYWNGGAGWEPIGTYTATFHGNGHVIANLFIDRGTMDNVGLFGTTGSASEVRNVGLRAANVTGRYEVGGLVGYSNGTIRISYVTGHVTGQSGGGLAGFNQGRIVASYATAAVTTADDAGGLVGFNGSGTRIVASYATGPVTGRSRAGGLTAGSVSGITASYATGAVTGDGTVGGLVGANFSSTTASYWDTTTSGVTTGSGGTGKTTTELQTPTGYTGIYATWNVNIDGAAGTDDPWDFGTASEYPVLKVDFDGDGTASWEEFGDQRPAPN